MTNFGEDERVVFYFRVLDESGVAFFVRRWYARGDGEFLFRGSECDCDAWEPHREIHPEERWCVHIESVKRHIDGFKSSGSNPEPREDGVEMVDIQMEVAPVQ